MSDLSSPRHVTLDDKYTATSGRVFLTGIQALVRLPMLQHQRDLAAGLNTAGFVSGYRGSPLGGLDQALWKAKPYLEAQHVVFQPGLNEDLAATAVWGTQQVNLFQGARYDGVFGMWYGKGPGVDRCGDVFHHANAAGSSKYGGVLLIAGDDHAAKSSSLPHQTDHLFKAMMIPVLYPANVQEYLDYGLHGWAMSRFSGCWVAMKALADTVETSASVRIDAHALQIVTPTDFEMPPGGLNIRWPDPPLVQEARLLHEKLYAALAYCRANRLNRVVIDSPSPRLGIITSGKSYLDVRQAFDELGIDDALAAEIGIRLYKVGMVWPLEAEGVRRFAEGLEEILVVEEKRQMLEYQLKEELYNWKDEVRPKVVGKFDDKGEWALLPDGQGHVTHGDWLLPAAGELSVAQIARAIASRIQRFFTSPAIEARLQILEAKQKAQNNPIILAQRVPAYCSGCPHNTSTHIPEGSRALAGIGCHYMATWLREGTATFSHMGGEGVAWVGQAPFTSTKHVFANLGDGTYFHSGLLAIRQAVAAFNAPSATAQAELTHGITYKILYNDAVAMTGGQPIDGTLTVPQLTRQLEAEGIEKIVIVTDDTEKYAEIVGLAPNVPIYDRRELDRVQRELREIPGVSILIYEQTCATEKRRRRKRGKLVDPAKRVFINEAVCEGCGDCSVQSSCLSVLPVDTEFGRKRAIDQSSCNKDYSCVNGFCPSFVTVEGGRLRRSQGLAIEHDQLTASFGDLPAPALPATAKPYNLLITGVGGTGVITLGALIGMAAHLDGKGVSILDMAGLAQKFGAVFSHLRIADRPEDIHASRIATGEADLILGGDLMVSTSVDALSRTLAGHTKAVVNLAETPTVDFTKNPDWQYPSQQMQAALEEACGEAASWFIDSQQVAEKLLGDALYGNAVLLGYAWQKGLVPVSLAALEQAIELNGSSIEQNKQALLWGRRAAHKPAAVAALVRPPQEVEQQRLASTVEEIIARRVAYLTDYQDAAYAERYQALVRQVQAREKDFGDQRLSAAVARYYFKLLAIKDEYEVARLYTEPAFMARIRETFDGDYQLRFHLAPPLFAKPDPRTGKIEKRSYGPWMMRLFGLLARLKGLRGGTFDLFGYSAERRGEWQLIADYEADIALILARLPQLNAASREKVLNTALALAELPEHIRGFGRIKAAHLAQTRPQRERLRAELIQHG
jgi:indolepyruvate ferredoxin oxidoreductase